MRPLTYAPGVRRLGAAGGSMAAALVPSDRSTVAMSLPAAPPAIGDCYGGRAAGTPAPDAPYVYSVIAEPVAQSFAQRVRAAPLIVLAGEGGYAPPRWTTADGARPADPHPATRDGRAPDTIITPERAAVLAVAKGAYALPVVWIAHFGGRIGRDCASGSPGSFARGRDGQRWLYFLDAGREGAAMPVPGDPRYRFHTLTHAYPADADDLVTIGPGRDIMGHRYDDPPRRTPLRDVLAAIAALDPGGATPPPR